MGDRHRRDDGGDLPPDPWAGLANPPTQRGGRRGHRRPPDVTSRDGRGQDGTPTPGWHPAGQGAAPDGTSRSLLAHPAVWLIVTAVAVLTLWALWLDRPPAPTPPPASDTISASAWLPPDLAAG